MPLLLSKQRMNGHLLFIDASSGVFQVGTTINNIIMGKIYVEHAGTYTVTNHDTGLVAVMELVKPRFMTFSMKAKRESQHLVRVFLSCILQPDSPTAKRSREINVLMC
jgi:hypothetical protein